MINKLDGKALAKKIKVELQEKIQSLQSRIGRPPGLAVLIVGDHPPSHIYVRNKEKACAQVGIVSQRKEFPAETSQDELTQAIQKLNKDQQIDGILVQLPLPEHLDSISLLYEIDPRKDVDGLHPMNLGEFLRGEKGLRSCTPAGVMRLLKEYKIELRGKEAVVVGRSTLVGKPMGLMLLDADSTVTIAHIYSENLGLITRNADILVVAVGKRNLITAEMVKPGAVVIDVGINRITDEAGNSRLVGDTEFESVAEVAEYITPVPGGVGPMTVAMLLQNTVESWSRSVE